MSYERTAEHRAKMSQAQKGKRHSWRSASTTPEVAARIASWWTPERREAKRQEVLTRNPKARYHGLSASRAAEIVREAGKCCRCQKTRGRLDIHHKDRNKHNQKPSNLEVLCHRCHMQEHRNEIGWAVYHQRKTSHRD
jgi:5-methylcytosine-specific restriction endonuclease McrA